MKLQRFFGLRKKPRLLIIRRVVGASMEPTLTEGQVVLASGLIPLRLSTVVVLRHAGIEKIKRIDKLENGTVFVTGDNPAASTDSRHFGALPAEVVIGTVFWPRG